MLNGESQHSLGESPWESGRTTSDARVEQSGVNWSTCRKRCSGQLRASRSAETVRNQEDKLVSTRASGPHSAAKKVARKQTRRWEESACQSRTVYGGDRGTRLDDLKAVIKRIVHLSPGVEETFFNRCPCRSSLNKLDES